MRGEAGLVSSGDWGLLTFDWAATVHAVMLLQSISGGRTQGLSVPSLTEFVLNLTPKREPGQPEEKVGGLCDR